MTVSRLRGPLLLTLGLAVCAWLIYIGVAATSKTPDASALAGPRELAFAPWEENTWNEAATRPSLVFLLVSDSLSGRALDLEAWLREQPFGATVAAQCLPVRIDRRYRPDLAERYAENQVPHISVLLPSGEALSRFTGEPDTWTEQLVETARYWRDHQAELRDRAEAFWQAQAEPATPSAAVQTMEDDLRALDSAVTHLVRALLEDHSGPALWRTDLDRYLSVRGTDSALSLHAQLRRARAPRIHELDSAALLEATRAEWLRTLLELNRFNGLEDQASALDLARAHWKEAGTAVTAEEAALEVRLARALGESVRPSYGGAWLGIVPNSSHSLPHRPDHDELDGYLTDALAWLECLLDLEDATSLQCAERLADSLWAGLWDSRALALRDKPAHEGYLREVPVFPRAQLGRAATGFLRLAEVTGQPRFTTFADSCILGFSPYAPRAGAAATLYGEALLRRAHAS